MEFGSDFHLLTGFSGSPREIEKLNPVYFADGRMALQHLIHTKGWKRIWIPRYFCYEIIDTVKRTGIEVLSYPDFLYSNDKEIISDIIFKENDVLLRMNFFGLRGFRDNTDIPVEVIEDHSHGLHTEWAQNSNADYCIASLRKTLPLPEGGIAWSPKGKDIASPEASTPENDSLTKTRYDAMALKASYLSGISVDKNLFRKDFIDTENGFDKLNVCAMSNLNREILKTFNAYEFDKVKSCNWQLLTSHLDRSADYLRPENHNCIPFSLVLRFRDSDSRNNVKQLLIADKVYPAILWPIPNEYTPADMPYYLSIHCDGRYNDKEILILANRINNAYKHGQNNDYQH